MAPSRPPGSASGHVGRCRLEGNTGRELIHTEVRPDLPLHPRKCPVHVFSVRRPGQPQPPPVLPPDFGKSLPGMQPRCQQLQRRGSGPAKPRPPTARPCADCTTVATGCAVSAVQEAH